MKTVPTLLLSCTLALSSVSFAAVSLPYSNDFSTDVNDFTESGSGTWTLEPAGTYQFATTGGGVAGISVVEATGIGGGSPVDFSVSSTINVSANSGTSTTWGFSLLDVSTTPSNYILVDFNSSNLLRVINIGGAGTGSDVNTSATASNVSFSTGTEYTLTAEGAYTGTDLAITFTVSDGTNSDSITSSSFSTATNYNGNAMGFRARSASGGGAGTTVAYDNFSIAQIPEPSIAILSGMGMLFLLRHRR